MGQGKSMRIPDDDPYRAWVYSLKGALLDAAMLASIPVAQWPAVMLPLNLAFMDFPGWPMLAGQGCLILEINCGSDPEFRWLTRWCRYGDPQKHATATDANGPDASTCLARLWLLTVETLNREVRRPDWEIHFRTYMRPVCPTNPASPTPAEPSSSASLGD
jgi:hypothetical protein